MIEIFRRIVWNREDKTAAAAAPRNVLRVYLYIIINNTTTKPIQYRPETSSSSRCTTTITDHSVYLSSLYYYHN